MTVGYSVPRQFARVGIGHLESAVLGVLADAATNGESLGAAKIGKRAGICRGSLKEGNTDYIATTIIAKLRDYGIVVEGPKRGKFRTWTIAATDDLKPRGG